MSSVAGEQRSSRVAGRALHDPGLLRARRRASGPSATAVVMLIQRICTGRIGRAVPSTMAVRMTRPSPMLVGRVQTMNLVRLSKTPRPSSMAASMVAKSSSVRTMSAASLATSVPPKPMATPMSACWRAGASLTPSPVMATTWWRDLEALDEAQLLLGRHPGEHRRLLDRGRVLVRVRARRGRRRSGRCPARGR